MEEREIRETKFQENKVTESDEPLQKSSSS